MEADIKLCEELLAMDSFNDGKGPKRDTGAAARVGRLTEERRGEIMTRLNKHRSAKTASSPTGSRVEPVAMTAAQRRERVQQLLLERQQRLAGGSAAKRSSPAASRRSLSPAHHVWRPGRPPPPVIPLTLRRVHHPRQGGRARWEKAVRPASAPRERPRVVHQPGVPAPFNLSARKAGRHSKEAIAERARMEEEKELTFKPKTIARPRSAKSALDTASGEERRARLSTPRTKLWEKCEEIRNAKENEETKDCTFKPKVGRGPRMANRPSSARARPSGDLSFPDRLYKDGDSMFRKREDAKRQIAEAEIASYPFQPAINDNSRAAVEAEGYKPIHERVNDLLRKKQESLAAARVQYELENPDLTFAPKVSEAEPGHRPGFGGGVRPAAVPCRSAGHRRGLH